MMNLWIVLALFALFVSTDAFSHKVKKNKQKKQRAEFDDMDDFEDDVEESYDASALYSIKGRVSLPSQQATISTRATLNGGLYVAFVQADGAFQFRDIPGGTYFLEVTHVDYIFDQIRIDVSARDRGKVRATPVATKDNLAYPLDIRPRLAAEYFQKKKGWSPTSLLKNPMMLMMGFTFLAAFVLPKLAGNIDPKEMEEMRAQMAGQGKSTASEATK